MRGWVRLGCWVSFLVWSWGWVFGFWFLGWFFYFDGMIGLGWFVKYKDQFKSIKIEVGQTYVCSTATLS